LLKITNSAVYQNEIQIIKVAEIGNNCIWLGIYYNISIPSMSFNCILFSLLLLLLFSAVAYADK